MTKSLYVGCAGWSIPKLAAADFPTAGSHLARYAQQLPAVEINSSFYRPHRAATYARWADTVPPDFRFAVKLPRTITHERRLEGVDALFRAFLGDISALRDRLGVLLVQLPPSLRFDPAVAREFFKILRASFDGMVACEPRHPSWFVDEPETILRRARVARVAADPAPVPAAATTGGWDGFSYHRLHGSPRRYYSDYPPSFLAELAARLLTTAARGRPTWCIFDNTAAGFAPVNARCTLAFASGRANYADAQ